MFSNNLSASCQGITFLIPNGTKSNTRLSHQHGSYFPEQRNVVYGSYRLLACCSIKLLTNIHCRTPLATHSPHLQ
ncbi:hypothetical protein XELAEV_18018892mg [Xenopus laevis]|uniref:Uncharacterized protein n=1 Tax=Xenopus laevis TaxID=8355 RepID=A0A974DF21_XENLA|nr:hypothetical protein XELAEV_18018892mg [Xenopus laevis]